MRSLLAGRKDAIIYEATTVQQEGLKNIYYILGSTKDAIIYENTAIQQEGGLNM